MTKKIIQQGAEATIILNTTTNTITKERIKKTYRHPTLDTTIRTQRTKHEAKILIKAKQAGMNVPNILNLNHKNKPAHPFTLQLEYLNADRLSETMETYPQKKQYTIMHELGNQITLMHQHNIIHSDLTTANTLFKNNQIYIIDFGLSYISPKIEHKAVDLHLLHQSLQAKHHTNHHNLFQTFLENYKHPQSEKIIQRLKIVEKRGRYKQQH